MRAENSAMLGSSPVDGRERERTMRRETKDVHMEVKRSGRHTRGRVVVLRGMHALVVLGYGDLGRGPE